jgi:hypothetical protein
MLTEENLITLQKNLQYTFANLDTLKYHLNLFHAYYMINDQSELNQLPFQEIKIESNLSLPAMLLTRQLRKRKEVLFQYLYQSIQSHLSEGGEKERRNLFNFINNKNKALSFLADVFKLTEFEYLKIEDPMHEELIITFCLFLINTVVLDARKNYSEAQIITWLNNLLDPVYKEFRDSQPEVLHLASAGKEALDFDSFEQAVLSITLLEIHKAFKLEPLALSFTDPEAEKNYYSQWLPYILEEVRATIAQQLEVNKKKKLRSSTIKINSNRRYDSRMEVFECEAKYLPDIDNPFAKEAVLIQPKTGSSQTKYSGIFAIASEKYFDKQTKTHKLVVYVLIEDVEAHKALFAPGAQWEMQWLAGLISFHRMYEACRYPSRVPFMGQIIEAKLPLWPKQDIIASLQAQSVQAKLNLSQFYSVSAFHQADEGYYCLQGPPGTGKTTTIVHLLKVLSQDSAQKILVCAPSNKAVRVIASRTISTFPELDVAISGVAKDLPELLRPFFVNGHAKMICEQMEAMLKSLTLLHNDLIKGIDSGLKVSLNAAESLDVCAQRILEMLDRCVALCQKLLSPCKFVLKTDATSSIDLLLQDFLEMRDTIRPVLRDYQSLFQDCIQMISSGELNAFPTLQQSTKLKSSKLKTAAEVATIKGQLESFYEKFSNELESFLVSLFRSSESIEILLLQRAQIVYCTLVASGRTWLKKHISGVDILIVDEASQCVEPETLIPLQFQPKKCLHVGDPKQLPATVISQAAKEHSYDNSMMLRMMELCGQTSQMLNIQYRMHPAICAWPSRRYYNNELLSAAGLAERPSPLAAAPISSLYTKPCIFFDVKGAERRDMGYSKSIDNPKEAEALIKTLSFLLPHLIGKEIGIITFYAAQVALLKQEFSKIRVPNKENVTISTVDGFQGEEKDLIFLSTVRACKDVGFLKDIRRLNVAITRPRHNLFIFGNGSSLMASNTDFTRLIEHYEKNSGADSDYQVVQYSSLTMKP